MTQMKKILIIGLVTLNLFSCKKGENDPSVSLRSRKARLTGEWVMKSIEFIETDTKYTCDNSGNCNYVPSTRIYSIKDGISSETVDNIESKEVESIEHKMTIDKDGTYKIYSKYAPLIDSDGNKMEGAGFSEENSEGIWSFVNKNKNKEYKNKERLSLTQISSSTTENNGSISITEKNDVFGGDLDSDVFWHLDKLSNKEMIFKQKSSYTSLKDGEKQTDTEEITIVWEKQ